MGLLIVPLIGFSIGGIVGGSAAAAIQSGIGNVAAGSVFAGLQSLGATGTLHAIGACAGAAIGGTVGGCSSSKF